MGSLNKLGTVSVLWIEATLAYVSSMLADADTSLFFVAHKWYLLEAFSTLWQFEPIFAPWVLRVMFSYLFESFVLFPTRTLLYYHMTHLGYTVLWPQLRLSGFLRSVKMTPIFSHRIGAFCRLLERCRVVKTFCMPDYRPPAVWEPLVCYVATTADVTTFSSSSNVSKWNIKH